MAAISRRDALLSACAGAVAAALPGGGWAAVEPTATDHGYSPLGALRYRKGFPAFAYVNADAPKGGMLRLARTGAFDTADTLHYPGQPPSDIRLIYDRLMVASDDETASYYGLLAEAMAVADDFSVIEIRLNEAARWHDGRPVTGEDVAFTFETLKERGAPFYRQAFRTLAVVAEASNRVTFLNDRSGDRDVIRRIATIPIHPAHVWRGRSSMTVADGLLGSGPYRLAEIEAPRRLVLDRQPDYWGADLGVNRGRWNFDRLTFDYYRDADVALEAFLADEYDLRVEDSPARWRSGYAGPALSAGEIRRAESRPSDRGALHGIVFNLRRSPLSDRRVRLALLLAYDFDAVNRTLFDGARQRFASVFGDTDLAARGLPRDGELAVLNGTRETIPANEWPDPDPLAGYPPAGSRAAVAEASRLLDTAGYPIRDGRRYDPVNQAPLSFALVSTNPLYDRPLSWLARAWERLGIGLERVQTDPASASRRLLARDFDLATLSWSPARLPGTAERLLWHGDLAESPRSYALSGIRDPYLDRAIEALETARAPAALGAAARAFDRVFRGAVVMLPLWRDNTTRLAWWDRFDRPIAEREGFPASPIDRWWMR